MAKRMRLAEERNKLVGGEETGGANTK